MDDLISRQAAIEALSSSEFPNSSDTDTISRQAAIAEFSCCELTPDGGIDANYAIDFLEQMPSVQPEIIRCKDCEYYELTEWVAHRCNLLGRSVYGNDFCAWAEPYKGEQE